MSRLGYRIAWTYIAVACNTDPEVSREQAQRAIDNLAADKGLTANPVEFMRAVTWEEDPEKVPSPEAELHLWKGVVPDRSHPAR